MRMQQRCIAEEDIELVLAYGREIFSRDAVFYFLGRREVQAHRQQGHLAHLDGVHVVCNGQGVVITVYRNREFKRKRYRNKPHYRRHHN